MKSNQDRYLWPLFGFYFIVNFGRALTFTFLPLYLSSALGLAPIFAGYALGAGLVVATLGGLYLGIQIDRLTPLRLLPVAVTVSLLAYLLLPLAHRFYQAAILIGLIELALTTTHLSTKSLLAGLLPAEQRGAAYSVTYTLINIAFVLAPLCGLALSHHSFTAPLSASALLCLIALATLLPASSVYRRGFVRGDHDAAQPPRVLSTLVVLARDARLRRFTIGGFFSAMVYARFPTWLSQYLGYATTAANAASLASVIVATNAVTVIALQYAIGRRIDYRNMALSVLIGSGLLIASLAVYPISLSYVFWTIATVLFSIGEVIIVPAEFLFIDSIAKEHMKGAYFGAQNFAMLGGGFSSILCGMVLQNGLVGGEIVFVLMVLCAVTGCAFYRFGLASAPPRSVSMTCVRECLASEMASAILPHTIDSRTIR